jgi:hypothetical protein
VMSMSGALGASTSGRVLDVTCVDAAGRASNPAAGRQGLAGWWWKDCC